MELPSRNGGNFKDRIETVNFYKLQNFYILYISFSIIIFFSVHFIICITYFLGIDFLCEIRLLNYKLNTEYKEKFIIFYSKYKNYDKI